MCVQKIELICQPIAMLVLPHLTHKYIENANSVETCHDLLCLEVCTQLFHLACSQFSVYEQTKYRSCLYRWGWNLPCFQALLVGAGNQAMALPAFYCLQFFTCVCGEPGNKTRTKYVSCFYKQVIPCWPRKVASGYFSYFEWFLSCTIWSDHKQLLNLW